MKYGLIGQKLAHSFSKDIHEKIGRYTYEHIELEPDEVGAFLEARDFDGLNVTMPYKQTVIPYLDELSDLAREVGAVNTILNDNGRLKGYNTDAGGMKILFKDMKIDPAGKKVLIANVMGAAADAAVSRREAYRLHGPRLKRFSGNIPALRKPWKRRRARHPAWDTVGSVLRLIIAFPMMVRKRFSTIAIRIRSAEKFPYPLDRRRRRDYNSDIPF